MAGIRLDMHGVWPFVPQVTSRDWERKAALAERMLQNRAGLGREWTGWLEPPDPEGKPVAEILEAAERIRAQADVFLVIGIGGSYLGARAGMEWLGPVFRNQLGKEKRNGPEIYFLGHQLSAAYLAQLFELLEGKEVAVNVISKSGTTTEPAVAFRLVREWMHARYGREEAARRIYATTDGEKGALRRMAISEGYARFAVPDDIGGRYSVLTAVGLLPLAVSGADIRELLRGAQEAADLYGSPQLQGNACAQYAVIRNELYQQGKQIELLVSYDPRLAQFGEWWKQLFGESEGKEGRGLFPATAQFPTDLHSLGQYVQQGPRHLFQTVLWVENPGATVTIPFAPDDADGLNDLSGRTVHHVNEQAFRGALEAHIEGGVPGLVLQLPSLKERELGHLFYFFKKACALSGYLLGVNPFDQPGVEAYKRKMFRLLGRDTFS